MDPSNSGDVEAPKDPGALQSRSSLTDTEILGHRNVFVGIHLPGRSRRSSHHHSRGGSRSHHGHHRHHHKTAAGSNKHHHLKTPQEDHRPVTPPAQRVQFILGEDHDGDSGHEPHPLFSEMEELFLDEDGEMEWKETARWVKFEEDVEEGGNRWSKPHVATLSLHSLFELRSMLLNGTVCLDMTAGSLDSIAELVLDNMVNTNALPFDKKAFVKEAILKKHRHQYEGQKHKDKHHDGGSSASNMARLPLIRSLAEIGRNHSASKTARDTPPKEGEDHSPEHSHHRLQTATPPSRNTPPNRNTPPSDMGSNQSGLSSLIRRSSSTPATMSVNPNGDPNDLSRNKSADEMNPNDSTSQINTKLNSHFMKKLPKGAEASNILVGELNVLDKPLSAFIRLSEAVFLGDLTEVPVPTRFIFILLGPAGEGGANVARYHEIGRAVATIMSDEVFHDVAYKAKKREHLLSGIDEFLDAVTVLPPGEWDPSIRIEPPNIVPSQENRKNPKKNGDDKDKEVNEEEEEEKQRAEAGLVRTGRLFGGLLNDIKRKKAFYLSDFKDGLAVQCVASFIFIYFACLTPIITFGGLLGDATENRIAAIESLVSGLIVGVTYGFLSGQPLTILGSTGPILVFETILFDFCKSFGWAYLSFRLCTGVWVGIILMILIATDASAFVCYITRFTEENFACLIAFIFIKKAFDKLIHIQDYYPVHESDCYCAPTNGTLLEQYGKSEDFVGFNATKPHKYPCEFPAPGSGDLMISGIQSVGCHYVPNAFLMSVILFFGTFLISFHLKNFKAKSFFPAKVRALISDFSVIIAIFSMSLVDYFAHVDTPKLSVPSELRPTWSGRGWLIDPLGGNPWWSIPFSIFPAFLATILIFMDQQITAVIVNRKEHKLSKGGGYHLDLLIVTVLIVICSIFGLPWFVAATVLSINHVKSLTRESETAAPGEKPQFLGIREQRVTHILIFLTIGLSVLMAPLLSKIPMPVLYGVFLYMGVASLNGLQFFDRMLLFGMPKKYQPDLPYLRRVPLKRVHLFTGIQMGCLVMLWVIKDIKQTSILFPIMLVVMMGVRKCLDIFFTKSELKILDDILPEFKRKERLNDEEDALDDGGKGDGENPAEDEQLAKRRASLRYTTDGIEVPLANGNVITIPCANSDINISEEMNRSGVWKSLDGNSGSNPGFNQADKTTKDTSGLKKRNVDSGKRMSTVAEDNNEDSGITIKIDKPVLKEKGTDEEKSRLVNNKDDETIV